MDGRIDHRRILRGMNAMKTTDQDSPPNLVTGEPEQTGFAGERAGSCPDVTSGRRSEAAHAFNPDHLVYALSAYRIKHITEDGGTSTGERRSGEVIWISTESHAGENVGETEWFQQSSGRLLQASPTCFNNFWKRRSDRRSSNTGSTLSHVSQASRSLYARRSHSNACFVSSRPA